MITGISILGASYLLSVAFGAAFLDEDVDGDGFEDDEDYCEHCEDVAPWLFVPVVGPFIGMAEVDDGHGGLLVLGALQLTGLGLMIGGIIQYKASKRAAQAQGFTHWKLKGDRELALDIATTPRFAGPRVSLSF